jgi:hypothetical protein
MSLPTWSLLLSGDPSSLALLPSRFQAPVLQVVREPDSAYYLYSTDFDPTANDVYGEAMAKFSILLGAVAALFGPGERLGWDSIRKMSADGTATHVKYGTVVMSLKASVIVTAEGGTPAPPAGDPLVAAASQDPDVRRAFEIFGKWEPNPVNLYKVFEIIQDRCGGQAGLEKKSWSGAKKKMDRFRRSMCHQDVTGDSARHERARADPPPNPMDIAEARAYIGELLRSWIAEL